MSYWELFMKAAKRMEENTAEGRNIKNKEENKMKYENEIVCGRGPESAMPVEDLTNMLHVTRAMAHEAEILANKIGNHLFGRKDEPVRCSEAKSAEPANFKDALAETRGTLKETIDALAKLCTLVGV